MRKMSSGLMMSVLVTLAVAAEQPAVNENNWLPSLQYPGALRNANTRDWISQAWHPDTDPLPPSSHQQWTAENEDKENAHWDSQDSLGVGPRFDSHGNVDENFGYSAADALLEILGQQESPQLAKRQPPRRLGSLVDLYKDIAHGLSPFVANTENELLPAKPERRSGRRPAACRFGPFGLVCWNAARRGTVMRQRSAQYTQ